VTDAAALADLLRGSARVVVFTGAGISTESGIPDFRSPGGIWTRMMPVAFADYLADPAARTESWRRRFEMEETWNAVRPNDGHRAVAELMARGIASHVITQNIDALHHAAMADMGLGAERVIELHGNTTYARCLDCGTRVEIADIRAHFDAHGEGPDCALCGGIVKTATISFGQPMPEDEMARAQAATEACDLMLVLGSSLGVYPAAGFPLMACRRGVPLAIINREPTPQDPFAALVIHAGIGPTMRSVIAAL
jgi:NAD-dependent deacetylase